VIAGAVEDEGGVCAGAYLTTDLGEMQCQRFAVGGRQNKGRSGATLWTNGAEDVGPFIALIARRANGGGLSSAATTATTPAQAPSRLPTRSLTT
jgi:hypothetical protein